MQTTARDNNALKHYCQTAKPAVERIVFALSAPERDCMFPLFEAKSLAPTQCLWTEPDILASPRNWHDFLQENQPSVLVSCWNTPLIPLSLLSKDSFPLRYVCHVTGSVRQVVPREFLGAGGIVTNWGNVISHTVAEHALLLILAALKNISHWHHTSPVSPEGAWGWDSVRRLKTRSLRGRKVGIHGFGNIARELVNLLKPFDVTCMAFSENVPAELMAECGVRSCNNLKELFAQNEILVECEALTPKTAGSVTAALLQLIPQDGIFVNVGRGAVVDEEALGRLVAQDRIRVASDVFQTEPLPYDSPFRNNPNAIVSPHIGGPTSDWFPQCGGFALSNIKSYLADKPLEGVVTLEIYDRSS